MISSRAKLKNIGSLLVEAVIAGFLLVFAFATAASLFDASLSWESNSGNARKAMFVAEKAMEDLRARTANIPKDSSFNQELLTAMGDLGEYEEAPGFEIKAELLANKNTAIKSSKPAVTPSDGVHSPCSSFYTIPLSIAAVPPLENPPNNNPQLNNAYATYPYSRSIDKSLGLVQITVSYGGDRSIRLISLLGDPILNTNSGAKAVVQVTRVSGDGILTAGKTEVYKAQLNTYKGTIVDNVTVLWSVSIDSGSYLHLLPTNSTGTRVEVKRRMDTAPAGSNYTAKVQALVRYAGQEITGESQVISLP